MTTLMVADLKADERAQPNRRTLATRGEDGIWHDESTPRLKAIAALLTVPAALAIATKETTNAVR